MKIRFRNKKGEDVMEINSMKENDISVLSESLKDLAEEMDVEDKTEENEDEEKKTD